MGNCVSIQLTFDTLLTRCVDCVAGQATYLSKLKGELESLKTATAELKAKKADVETRLRNEEGPQRRRRQQVQDWLTRVEAKIPEVDELINDGPQEMDKLCCCANCSTNYTSSREFVGKVSEGLNDVNALKAGGEFQELVDTVTAEPVYVSRLQDDLRKLKSATEELGAAKEDVISKIQAQEGQLRKPLKQVQVWLKQVEDAITEADKLTRDGPQEAEKWLRGDLCNDTFGQTVEKGLADVGALKAREFKEVTERVILEPVVERPIEPTVGLEGMLDKVWSCLMEEQVGIVGLYGMGGVGKTTLLTQLNNKFLSAPNDFDVVIWVVVSKDFRLEKVQDEIAKKIGISVEDWKTRSLDDRANHIFHVLRKTKFVLLLDDIWERIDLKKIGIPFPRRQSGSKVVFTTRSEVVCGQMDALRRIKVEPLAWEKAWQLFRDKVGEDTIKRDPAIFPLAEDIARECAGLPLALITIGRAMALRKTVEQWRTALQVLKTSAANMQGMGDEVFPLLKFSYDSLDNERIKSCFLYCSLFPEDFKICKNDLIDYWSCEAFWDEDDTDISDHVRGSQIIDTLAYACLLDDDGQNVKMHDVIRDMALWIACDLDKATRNYLVKAGAQITKAPEGKKWKDVRRVSLMENFLQKLTEEPMCPELMTLLLCRNPRLRDICTGFFKSMNALTVLDLSNTNLQELPPGVGNLVSLQYLNLSHTQIEELSPELEMLKNMKFLNLEHNAFLGLIPSQVISSMSQLQVLKMYRCGFFFGGGADNILFDNDMLVKVLQHLKDLNTLTITIKLASALDTFFSSDEMPSCTQALSLEWFRGTNSLDMSRFTRMEQLHTLLISASQDLEELNFGPAMRGRETRGPANPLNLTISMEKSFINLQEVTVEYCSQLRNLRWLVHAPNLTALRVSVCEKMEEIISAEHLDGVSDPFAKLEVLVLEDLPKLKKIYQHVLPFPCLLKIKVLDCPLLKKLPLNSNSTKGSNFAIEAEEYWWRDIQWEDAATKIAFLPCYRSCPPRKRVYRVPYFF